MHPADPTTQTWSEPVLVTGAAGFIGRHLIDRLRTQGVTVRALLLPEEMAPEDWHDVEIVRGDVTDADTMAAIVKEAGTVFHLAAVVTDWGPEELFQRVTVDGTANVLLSAARYGVRAVLASSIVVYGDDLRKGPCPEDHRYGAAQGPYSRAKQAQEQLAIRLAEDTDLQLTVVRPGNVFGVGSRPWVEMVLPLLKKRDFTLISGGNHAAGLCHVKNLVEILRLAGSLPSAVGRIYNACDPADITWKRYFADLARIVGAPAPRSVPGFLARPTAAACERWWRWTRRQGRPPMTFEALNLTASALQIPIDRARQELGYRSQITYDDAIAELEFYLTHSGEQPGGRST